MGEGLDFRVLGPLAVLGDGREIELGAPKHRALLALLLLQPGRVVSVDRLIDQLWNGAPPAGANATLQAYVSNLRRILEPERPAGAPATVLVTRPPGYALAIEPEQVDAVRFERALAAAANAHQAGQLDHAAATVAAALASWRGQPFADTSHEPWAQAECERLAELHLAALETQLAVELDRGRHASAVIEAERLCKEHPVRERFRELLMVALYRSGRQAEALRAYQDARDVLVEELGIEPGPALRELEGRILAQDRTLDWHPPAPSAVVGDARPEESAAPVGTPAPGAASEAATALDASGLGVALRFVGRRAERARFTRRADEVRRGAARLVLVSGEPGIGKTRLCEELAAGARASGMQVVWARGWEGDGAPAFWPWVQVLRSFVEELPADVVAEAVGPAGTDLARVVPDYERFARTDDDVPDAETARFRFFDAVTALLGRVGAHRPLVVVIDDLHWADQSSLRLLEFAVSALHEAPVLIVGTYRDAEARTPPLATSLATLAKAPELERLALAGLSVAEVGAYLDVVVGEGVAPGLAQSLRDRTAGNPFFVAELVRLLQYEGRLGEADTASTVPKGVRDVIRTRLDRLPDDALPVLTAGAIAGRDFDVGLVAHVCGIDEDRALDLVEAAWMIGVVDEVPEAFGHFRFAHELVREALCEDLTTLRRIRLHRRIGEAIEELHGFRNPGFLTACAYHFSEAAPAGDQLKAVLYGQKAADRLVSQYAYEDAIPIYERAIALAEQYDVGSYQTRVDLLIGLGWALRASGRLADARRILRRALERSEEHDDEIRIARAVLGIGGGSFWGWWDEFGVSDEGLVEYLERALQKLGDDDSVLRCELLARLAIESYFLIDREQREWLTSEALAMARRLEDPVALTAALAARHLAMWRIENLDDRRAVADELVAVAQEHGIGYAELIGRHFRMVDALEAGDRAAFDADYERCERLAERLGQHAFRVQLAWFRSSLAFIEGDFVAAERLMDDAFALNVASAESAAWTAYGAQLFNLRREQGRHGELEPLLQSAAERQPHVGAAWRVALGLIAAEHGRPDEARALVADLLVPGVPAVPGNDLLYSTYLVRLAELCAAVGDADGAALLLPELDRFAGPVAILAAGHLCWGAIDRLRGDLLRTLGRHDEAVAALRHAMEVDRAIGSRSFENRDRLGLARALLAVGAVDEARAVAAEAVAVAEEIGAVMVAAEARALIA